MVVCFIYCGPRLLRDAWLASVFLHRAAVFAFSVVSLKHKLWSIDVHLLLLTGVVPWLSASCLRHSLLAKPRLFFCLQFDTFNVCIWVFDICWVNLYLLWYVLQGACRGQRTICRARCLHPPWIRGWTEVLRHARSLSAEPSHQTSS